jgi:hypothetical protein
MNTTMTAQEIGEAWLTFISETFMLDNGCNRPDVQEEYADIERTHTFARGRESWRSYTDALIERILQSPPESLPQLYSATDSRSLAYVQDRIHCGTDLLTALVQKGLQINLETASSLPDFFRQILLQKEA